MCLRHLYFGLEIPISLLDIHLTSARLSCRRFLRARQFDVRKAVDFFRAACQARNDSNFDKFYENLDIDDYEDTRKLVCHDSQNANIIC